MANDWEALHGQLDAATGAWTRDELVVLLRDLIREYVVERGLPTGTPAEAATPDLTGMDFAQLITWLKRNLSLPELNLFSIDGRRVIVDAEGPRVLGAPRDAAPTPAAAAPAPTPAARPVGQPAASAPPAAAAETDESAASKRKLSRGFRGLEFD